MTLLPTTVREGLETMLARPLVIVHDREASRVPWEVLRVGTTHPALGAGLSRRYTSDTLSVARWRDDHGASDPLRVLLIVDPTRDLPGAAAEGEALQQLLGRNPSLDVLSGVTRPGAHPGARHRRVRRCTLLVTRSSTHASPTRWPALPRQEVWRPTRSVGNLPALVFCNVRSSARAQARQGERVAGASVRNAPHDDGSPKLS
jgi:hypothetical protein